MDLQEITDSIRNYPGVTRKRSICSIVSGLPLSGFPEVVAAEGEDAAAIEHGNDCILLATDGIMESLLNIDPFYAGYFAVLVNVNDIAAMGGKPLAMVDVLSHKNDESCSKILEGMNVAVQKFKVPIVGGHTHPDCKYHAIDISIVGVVPTKDLIRSDSAKPGDDVVFVMDLDGFFPEILPYAWDTTTRKDGDLVRAQMDVMCKIASEGLAHACKDMSNPGSVGTLGMLLETSRKGATIDLNKIPTPKNVNFLQWLLTYQGCGFVFACPPENSQRIIDIFSEVGCAGAVVGKIEDTRILRLVKDNEESVLFDFTKDIITGCVPKE